jgi:hypothetical protein
VTVADAADSDAPKVTLRRARRTDPLEVLKRAGTIDARGYEAGEKLRCTIEQLQRSLPGVSRSEVHVAPQDCTESSLHQRWACRKVREALAALDITVTPPMLWVLHGGTIRGYAAFAHVRHTTAAELLRRGLGALADHCRLARPRAE